MGSLGEGTEGPLGNRTLRQGGKESWFLGACQGVHIGPSALQAVRGQAQVWDCEVPPTPSYSLPFSWLTGKSSTGRTCFQEPLRGELSVGGDGRVLGNKGLSTDWYLAGGSLL